MDHEEVLRALQRAEAAIRASLRDDAGGAHASNAQLYALMQQTRATLDVVGALLTREIHQEATPRCFEGLFAGQDASSVTRLPPGLTLCTDEGLLWLHERFTQGAPAATLRPLLARYPGVLDGEGVADGADEAARAASAYASVLGAMWCVWSGRAEEALDALAHAPLSTPGARVIIAVYAARALRLLGRGEEALTRLEACWMLRASLSQATLHTLLLALISCALEQGDLVTARRHARRADVLADADPRTWYNRHLRVLHLCIAASAQDHHTLARYAAQAAIAAEPAASLRGIAQLQQLHSALFRCRLEQFDALAARVLWTAEASASPDHLVGWVSLARLIRDVLDEAEPPPAGPPEALCEVAQRTRWQLWRQRGMVRRGGPLDGEVLQACRAKEGALAPLAALVEVEAAITSGPASRDRVAAMARRGVVVARQLGLHGQMLELELYECFATLDTRAATQREEALADIAERARGLGIDRLACCAEVGIAATRPRVDLPRLCRALHRDTHAPLASRLARALLFGATALRDHDATFAEHLAELILPRVDRPRPTRLGALDAEMWGLDVIQKRLWRASGISVDLRRRPAADRMLRLLSVAPDEGCTKEQLARTGWELDVYHPARDDNRLHVAIARLRASLEDDPSSPVFIQTTEAGYRANPAHTFWMTR